MINICIVYFLEVCYLTGLLNYFLFSEYFSFKNTK